MLFTSSQKVKSCTSEISVSLYYLLTGGAQLGASKETSLESGHSLDWKPCWSQLSSSQLITEGDGWLPCQGCCRAMAGGAATCCLLMTQPPWPAALVGLKRLVQPLIVGSTLRRFHLRSSPEWRLRQQASEPEGSLVPVPGLNLCTDPEVQNVTTSPGLFQVS